MRTAHTVCWVPNYEWHHVFKQPLWAHVFLGHVLWRVQWNGWQNTRSGTWLGLMNIIFYMGLGLVLWRSGLGLLDGLMGLRLVGLAHEKIWVSKVQMEPFIGNDKSIWVLNGSLNLLLGTAPWVCAPIVTPACSMALKLVMHN